MAYNVCNGTAAAGSLTLQVTVGTGNGSPVGSASGDLVYVATGASSAAVTVSSVTDSQGNTYAAVVSDTTQNPSASLWVSLTTHALVSGTDWIKVTWGTSGSSKTMVARGSTGVTSATADKTNSGDSAATTAPSSGSSGVLTQAAELVVGVICNGNAGNAPTGLSFGAPTTAHLGGNYLTLFDTSVNATTAMTASGTISAAAACALIATFKLSSGVSITTASPLPGGTVGTAYSDTLAASGGTAPYTWSLTAGTLPAGLALTGGAGLPAGGTITQSGPGTSTAVFQADMTTWSNLVYQVGVMKIYFQQGKFPTSKSANAHIQACINLGIPAYLCYKPAFSGTANDPTWPGGADKPAQGNASTPGTILGDQAAMIASVTGIIAGGLSVAGIVLWQEAELAQNSVAADQFTYLFYQHYAALKAAFPAIPVIANLGGLGTTNATVASYFPGPTPLNPSAALYCDGVGVDLYCTGAVNSSGTWIRPMYTGTPTTRPGWGDIADYAGIAFGWMEAGNSASGGAPAQSVVTKYLSSDASIGGDPVNSIQAIYATRIAAGFPFIPFMWWQDNGSSPPGPNVISNSSDYRIPLLRSLAATINTGTGGGVISGTPTTAATSNFTVQAADASASKATKALALTISAGTSPVVTTTSLPGATTGVVYTTTTLTESGGTGPFTWTNPGGGLPAGLSLSTAGVISGTPTATAGPYSFTITVTDSLAATGTVTLSITVVPPPPPITPGGGTPAAPLAGYPQLIAEAGFTSGTPVASASALILNDPNLGELDTGTLSDATAWTDLTTYVRTVTISRPSSRVQGPLRTYQAATSAVAFDNTSGNFDPDNTAGAFVSGGVSEVGPMVQLRFRAIYGNVEYHLFSGFDDSWTETAVTYDAGYSEVTASATDGFKILAGITLPAVASLSAGEPSGSRVLRILTAAGWFTDHRRAAAGDTSVQPTGFGDTALNLLQLTADTEIGELYMDGSGNVVFRNRHAAITETRSTTAQAVFGDLPGTVHGALTELAYAAVGRANDDTTLANDVQVTRVGGTLQEVQGAGLGTTAPAPLNAFARTYARSDVILLTDPEALGYAQWVLYVSLAGEDRFDTLTIDPIADPVNLFPQVLGREIGDLITVYRRPQNSAAVISKPCFIRGITHAIDVVNGTWQTTWDLQDASRYAGFLILDDPVLGKVSSGNKLAY